MQAEAARATAAAPGKITLHGDIDRGADAAVTKSYDEAKQDGGGTLTLDFSDVTYINSTGIAVIVGLLARARSDGISVEAYGLSDHYRHVFQVTRLADFMTIHTDELRATGGTR